jgi:hypothetical protein
MTTKFVALGMTEEQTRTATAGWPFDFSGQRPSYLLTAGAGAVFM